MDFSERALHMPSSPIRKLVPFATQAKKEGKKVYHLNIGQPDIASPKSAMEALKNIDLKVLEYSLSQGNLPYRKTLAQYYTSLGIEGMKPEHFIITNGGSEALHIAFSTICDEGDEIIIPEPYYANYNGFASALGIKVVAVTSYIDTGFALPKIEDIEKKITPKTKAIVINNPSNPTGTIYSYEELEQLQEVVLKHNLYLISDEVYREYAYDNEKVYSVLEFEKLNQNSIIIESESKRFSLCGARIGALVTKNKKFYKMAMKFAQARLSPVLLGQIAANAAYQEFDSYTSSIKIEFKKRRDVLVELLNEIPGVICPTPKGAFYCMVELPIDDSDKFAQWLLEDFSFENETVMVAPATGFYENPELGKKQVRIAYVLKEEELKRAVMILKKALEKYKKL